jgi:hypothetical protein
MAVTSKVLARTAAATTSATLYTWIVNDQGDLTAVTAGTGITVTDSTGPIPTVAFDYRAGSAVTLNAQTATYTVVLEDADQKLVTMDVATANDFLIPTNANVAFPVGTVINVIQIGAGRQLLRQLLLALLRLNQREQLQLPQN